MQASSEHQTASGLAAVSIRESLLVSLWDLKVMGEKEVVGVLTDASALAMWSLPRRIRKSNLIDRIRHGRTKAEVANSVYLLSVHCCMSLREERQ